jgi:hypothetical protein
LKSGFQPASAAEADTVQQAARAHARMGHQQKRIGFMVFVLPIVNALEILIKR